VSSSGVLAVLAELAEEHSSPCLFFPDT
jgi:hypothetical protein